MKRQIRFIIPLLLILSLVASCANLQNVWEKATPQERCRIIAFKMERTLNGAFDAGKLYIASQRLRSGR